MVDGLIGHRVVSIPCQAGQHWNWTKGVQREWSGGQGWDAKFQPALFVVQIVVILAGKCGVYSFSDFILNPLFFMHTIIEKNSESHQIRLLASLNGGLSALDQNSLEIIWLKS
jgi:hypothetical protein